MLVKYGHILDLTLGLGGVYQDFVFGQAIGDGCNNKGSWFGGAYTCGS